MFGLHIVVLEPSLHLSCEACSICKERERERERATSSSPSPHKKKKFIISELSSQREKAAKLLFVLCFSVMDGLHPFICLPASEVALACNQEIRTLSREPKKQQELHVSQRIYGHFAEILALGFCTLTVS